MAIIAGDLRQVIDIKRLSITKDAYGAVSETYTTVYTLRAAVKYQGGNRLIDNNEIFNSQTLVFTTYYRTIENTDRIVFNSKKYKILFIAEIGYKEGLQITAEMINE